MDQNKSLYFFNKSRGTLLASEARVASSFVSRLVGLLKTASLAPGQGLYIAPCNQIHMWGMKYAIDVVFMDKDGTVQGLCQQIEPGQVSPLFLKAYTCLELPTGIIESSATAMGDQIERGSPPCPHHF